MIDVEQQGHLERLVKLAEENNKLLRKLHRSLMVGRTFRILYWLVIIGAAFGALYFLQPYLESVQGLYNNVTDAQENFGSISDVLFGQGLPPLESTSTAGATE